MESSLGKYQTRSEVELVLANYARAEWSITKKVPVCFLEGAKGNGSASLQYCLTYKSYGETRTNPERPQFEVSSYDIHR